MITADVGTRLADSRYCPKCDADWRSSEIPRESLAKGYYGHESPCERKRAWDADYSESTPCTCPPRFFSRLVGIEIPGKYDGVSEWMCPDCETRWDRWTGEQL